MEDKLRLGGRISLNLQSSRRVESSHKLFRSLPLFTCNAPRIGPKIGWPIGIFSGEGVYRVTSYVREVKVEEQRQQQQKHTLAVDRSSSSITLHHWTTDNAIAVDYYYALNCSFGLCTLLACILPIDKSINCRRCTCC